MRHCLLLVLFSLLTGPMQGAFAQDDTLAVTAEAAIRRSLKVSPEIDVNEAQQNYAEARYSQARASRFLTEFQTTTGHAAAPGLEGVPSGAPKDELYLEPEVDNDWTDPRPYNQIEYEALQPIWTWGELSGNIDAAEHGIAVEAAKTRSKALEVAFRTGELYYNVLLAEELYRIAEETGSIVERAKSQINELLQDTTATDVDQADLFQVRLTEQEYRRRLVQVTQRRKTARMGLRRQLFLPDSTLPLPEAPVLQPLDFDLRSLRHYLDLALANRPEIEQAEAGLAARNAQVEVARSDYYPKLFLRVDGGARYAAGRYKQENAYINDNYLGSSLRAGLGFRQQLNFFQTEAKVEQAEAQRNEVRYQQEAARQLALAETEEAYREVVAKRTAVQARDTSLTISKEWLRTEQVSFDLDLPGSDTENLVKAVRRNLELQASYYETVKAYNVAVLKLLRVTGVLARRARSGTLVDDS
jgi:outer membrane protein TolC